MFKTNKFSQQLYDLRVKKQLSVREAAGEIGISHSTVSRIENGSIPDVASFACICVWAGWKANDFFKRKKGEKQ